MNMHFTPPAPASSPAPIRAVPILPSHRAIMEAAMITYRRWRAMGRPHDEAVRYAMTLIRRIEDASREACR